jgi:hypothetical protein
VHIEPDPHPAHQSGQIALVSANFDNGHLLCPKTHFSNFNSAGQSSVTATG